MPQVLLVEDNAVNRSLARALLGRAGCGVVEAGSLADASRCLAEGLPDLVLLDLGLPDGDGLDLVRRLRADPRTAALPVVAVTAYAMAADRERALAAGCTGFLTKPLDARGFAGAVAAALAGG